MGNLLGLVPVLLVEVAFLVAVGLLSRGRVRLLGLGAGVLWLTSTLLNALALPFLYGELDLPSSSIGLISGLFGLFHWAAMILVAIALVIGGRADAARTSGGDQSGQPSSQSPPPQPWGQQSQPPQQSRQGQPPWQSGQSQPPEQQRPWQDGAPRV